MARGTIAPEGASLDGMNAVGFYSWNVAENRVYGDDVIAHVFGLSTEDLSIGMPIDILVRYIDDGDKQRVAKAIHTAIISGEAYYAEYGLTHPDGHKVSVRANGRCLRDADGVPSIYSGTVTVQPAQSVNNIDPLESHCRAALGIASERGHALAARYLSSALHMLRPNFG
jgi:PAS domain-containing protein